MVLELFCLDANMYCNGLLRNKDIYMSIWLNIILFI
jgi:hypothetical protein